MIEKVKKSMKIYKDLDDFNICPIVKNYKIGNHCDTVFRYELDSNGKSTAKIGLQDLENTIFLLMTFNPSISSIEINNKITFKKESFKKSNQYSVGKINIFEFEINHDNFYKNDKFYVGNMKDNDTSVSLLLKKINENSFEIIQKNRNVPTFFVDFPLIGSENFIFPFYINSHYFYPNEPRSWILLNREPKAKYNKELLESSMKLIMKFVEYVCENKWKNCHYLAENFPPYNIDQTWYNNEIQMPYRKKILSSSIIETDCDLILLKNSVFPFDENGEKSTDKLREILYPIYKNQMIKNDKEYLKFWNTILDNNWEFDNNKIKFTISDLLKKLHYMNNLEKAMDSSSFNKTQVFKWINNIISFIFKNYSQSKAKKILNSFYFIPNQLEYFGNITNLKIDDNIPKEIKDILDYESNNNFRSKLLHSDINNTYLNLIEFTLNDSKKEIDSTIIEYNDQRNIYRIKSPKSFYKLFSLLPSKYDDFYENFHKFVVRYTKEISSEKIYINNKDINFWEKSKKILLKMIYEKLNNCKSLRKLFENLNLGSNYKENDIIAWLNDFYKIYTKSFNFNENSKIFPNQLGNFCKISYLKYDKTNEIIENDDINVQASKLKFIYNNLMNEEIEGNLIDLNLDLKCLRHDIPSINKQILSNKIDSFLVSNLFELKKSKKKIILEIDQVYKLIEKDESKLLFFPKYFYNRPNIIVVTMLDNEDREKFINIIKCENLDVFVRAIDNNIEKEDLEIYEKVKKYPNLINQISSSSENEKEVLQIILKEEKVEFKIVEFTFEILLICGITNDKQFFSIFKNEEVSPSNEIYLLVKKAFERSIENVKNYLKNHNDYNIDNWSVDKDSQNFNIINGVKKFENEIILTIRPIEKSFVEFNDKLEIESLKKINCEFWGDDGITARYISLGEIINQNDLWKFQIF